MIVNFCWALAPGGLRVLSSLPIRVGMDSITIKLLPWTPLFWNGACLSKQELFLILVYALQEAPSWIVKFAGTCACCSLSPFIPIIICLKGKEENKNNLFTYNFFFLPSISNNFFFCLNLKFKWQENQLTWALFCLLHLHKSVSTISLEIFMGSLSSKLELYLILNQVMLYITPSSPSHPPKVYVTWSP